MKELSGVMMGAMMLLIGLVLACTTLFLAITTVIRGEYKNHCDDACVWLFPGGMLQSGA